MKTYYEHTLTTLEGAIREKFPHAVPREDAISNDMPSYLLWMIEKIRSMNRTSLKDALKAARWLGWILAVIERELLFWDNRRSREIVRQDVKEGNDMPIQKGEQA